MYIIVGYTYKGETFIIGHTTSYKKAHAFVDNSEGTAIGDEYKSLEVQVSAPLSSLSKIAAF